MCAAGPAVGTMKLSFSNNLGICMTDTGGNGDNGDSALDMLAARGSGSSGGVDWRVAVGASVSVALLAAALTLAGILLYARMQRRALLAKEEAAKRELASAPPWQQVRPDAPRCTAGLAQVASARGMLRPALPAQPAPAAPREPGRACARAAAGARCGRGRECRGGGAGAGCWQALRAGRLLGQGGESRGALRLAGKPAGARTRAAHTTAMGRAAVAGWPLVCCARSPLCPACDGSAGGSGAERPAGGSSPVCDVCSGPWP